jgi:hypothetical protein
MPAYVVIVDLVGLLLVAAGGTLAFRQHVVRRLLGRPEETNAHRTGNEDDPLTYALRIAGTMMMVFGIAMAGMVTLFNLQ